VSDDRPLTGIFDKQTVRATWTSAGWRL